MDEVDLLSWAIYCLALGFSHLVMGVTGFGAIVLALPVLTFFFPVKTLIPALVAVNLAQAAWFAVTERRHIHQRHARSIIVLALAGLPIGYAVFKYLSAEQLKIGLGAFVVVVAAWNLAGIQLQRQVPAGYYHLLNFLGGITQGALACGGPFVVIYAARMLTDKSAFRATLSLVWTVLNSILCITYLATGRFGADTVPLLGLALPGVAFGTVAGIVLHERIPQKPFRVLVFTILFISGLVLLRPLISS